jgi:energy-coupling factor transporter transmembrane protein EcfT
MKLNQFDEKVHSIALLTISLFSYLSFFLSGSTFCMYLLLVMLTFIFLYSGLSIKKVCLFLFGSILFSLSYSLMVLSFPNKELLVEPIYHWWILTLSKKMLLNQLVFFNRVTCVAMLSISSVTLINYEKVLIYLMKRKWLRVNFGYPVLLSLNSIGLLKSEFEKIRINAKFRNIPWRKRIDILFPILVFSIRHAERGAMSLITRGISEKKEFYFDVEVKRSDIILVLSFLIVYLSLAGLYLYSLK